MPRVHVGTSGWHYEHWRGVFYPPDLPARRWLEFYARYFDSVEINNSFYHLPSLTALRAWRAAVPRSFVFTAKGSRFTTHMKKLKAPRASTGRFFRRMAVLGRQLRAILFQLPPHWTLDLERFEAFLGVLPRRPRCAFEFRDPTWFDPRVYRLLRGHGAGLCIYHLAGLQSPLEVTADFVYVRLHGPGAEYQGRYGPRRLRVWADRVRSWRAAGREVFFYFDNDQAGYAVQDALELKRLIGRG